MSAMNERTIKDINAERLRQVQKWGVQRNSTYLWNTILGEEIGEVNKASLDIDNGLAQPHELEEELIQVIAVAVAYLEDIRGETIG